MKQYLTLFRQQMQVAYSISSLRDTISKGSSKERLKLVGYAALFIYLYAMLGGLYGWYSTMIYSGLAQMNQAEGLVTMAVVGAQVVLLVLGIFSALGTLFFAKDAEFLASLPIKQRTVFAAKFTRFYLLQWVLCTLFTLPPLGVYLVMSGAPVLIWLRAILVGLFLPMLPLCIASLLAALLMRWAAFFRRSDLIAVIGGFLLMGGAMVANMKFSSMIDNNPELLMSGSQKIIDVMGAAFPPSIWATNAITAPGEQGVRYLLLLLFISLCAFGIMVWICGAIYHKGVAAQQEQASMSAKAAARARARKVGRRGPMMAMFFKEWRMLLRTPVYAMNGLTSIVIGPIMLLLMNYGSGSQDITSIQGILDSLPMSLVAFGCGAFALLISGINPAAATMITREGKDFWLMRSLPIAPKDQILGKFLCGTSIGALSFCVTFIASCFLFKFSLPDAVPVLCVGVFSCAPICAANLALDILHPRLNWETPQQAIKQNMNVILGMLLSFVLVLIIGALAALFIVLVPMLAPWLLLVVSLLLAIASFALLHGMEERYSRIAE